MLLLLRWIWLCVVASGGALITQNMMIVNACPPFPATPLGPKVGWLGRAGLFTSPANPHLLGAEVENYGEDGEVQDTFPIVIDLRDGSVTAGNIPDPTAPSLELDDPTGGYEIEVSDDGRMVTLASATAGTSVDVTLFASTEEKVDAFSVTFQFFFVSPKLQRAYLFHEVKIDCGRPGGVVFSGCEACPTCILEQSQYVSIVDLATGQTTVQVFENSLGGFGFLDDTGPFNSSQLVVYDDLQFASTPSPIVCVLPFVFYNETMAEDSTFNPSYVPALVPGSTMSPREATAYRPIGREVTVDSTVTTTPGPSLPYSITLTMTIQQERLIDREVIRSIDVDMEQIRRLTGFDITRFITVPPPWQPPVQSPVVTLPPVAAPTTMPPLPSNPHLPLPKFADPMKPSHLPTTTQAPVVAPILPGDPVLAPAPPVPPLTLTRAPFPTVPIYFPVVRPTPAMLPSPVTPSNPGTPDPLLPTPLVVPRTPVMTTRPVADITSPAPLAPIVNVPTIPIAWGPAVTAKTTPDALVSSSSSSYTGSDYDYWCYYRRNGGVVAMLILSSTCLLLWSAG
jgi:hypothetical protein